MNIEIILDGKPQVVSKHQLFALASQGAIGPETIIHVDAKPYSAKKVKGIVFGNKNVVETPSEEVAAPSINLLAHYRQKYYGHVQPIEKRKLPTPPEAISPSGTDDDLAEWEKEQEIMKQQEKMNQWGNKQYDPPAPKTTQTAPRRVAVTVSQTVPKGTPSTGALWMHWTWPFFPLITLIIWTVIKNKEHQANTHGKHILNAFFTLSLFNFILGIVGAVMTILSGGFIEATMRNAAAFDAMLIFFGISLLILIYALFFVVRAIISAIKIGIAAGDGKILSYTWAIRFFKTDNTR